MTRLACLAPRLEVANIDRVPTLQNKAGSTPRTRGREWMAMRRETLLDGGYTCVDCGLISASNEIDHDVPLEQGGTDDPSNRKVRCITCHAAKTAREASARAGR